MRNRPIVFLTLTLTLHSLTPAAAEDLESQFMRFLSWWPGTYDNRVQALASGETVTPIRLHLQPVDLPSFGSHVVYGEWQDLSTSSKVIRQRFYAFEIDRSRQALRLKLHIFPPAPDFVEQTRGAYRDTAKIAALTPEDMIPLPGCDVFFRWQGDHFAGAMEKRACAFQAPGTSDDIYSWSQMRLTADSFQYLDGWFHPDGSVYRVLADDWYVFERTQEREWDSLE